METQKAYSDVKSPGLVEPANGARGWQAMTLESVLQGLVVAAGMLLGGILALIIGFSTGWLVFSC